MLALKEVTDELHPVVPCERATTLLLVVFPRTIVHGAVGEGEDTVSLLLVVLELAFVVALIWPAHLSLAFSLAIHPVASVNGLVRPFVRAFLPIGCKSLADIFLPVAIVLRSISPSHAAFSVSLVLKELAFVSAAVWIPHCALPVLHTIEPFAIIFSPIGAFPSHNSLAMDFVVLEVTFVRIAVGISQRACSFFLIVNPSTVVSRLVSVRHFSLAMSFVFLVVAVVNFFSSPSEYAFTILLLVQPHTIVFVAICVSVDSLLVLRLLLHCRLLNGLGHLNCV